MRPVELGLVYGLVGLAVALAHWRLRQPGMLWSFVLWPVFLPGLLARTLPGAGLPPRHGLPSQTSTPSPRHLAPGAAQAVAAGPWESRIAQALAGLREALSGWSAWPELGAAEASLATVERGLRDLAWRVGRLEALQGELPGDDPGLPELSEARARNRDRLEALVRAERQRLEHSLSAVTELGTQVLLARYSGEDAGDIAEELCRLAEVVAAVGEVGGTRAGGPAPRLRTSASSGRA